MTNIFTTAFVLIAFIATASAFGQCGALENECYTTSNGLQCYLDGQYTCEVDDFTGDTILAAAGTKSCNNQLYATCAYQCDAGQLSLRADRTCPAPPSCGSDLPCGEACYNPEQFCCINSVPTLSAQCPAVFPTTCSSDSKGCNVTFAGIGQLADGQIRQNFGAGAFEVSFSFDDGKLYDNRGQVCYVTSPENQVQCNYNAQFDTTDGFCLSEDPKTQESFLAYQGTTLFYACATGTGGYNIYTSNIVGTYCQPIFIELDTQTCPEVIETSSTIASTSSEEEETTSSAVAPTTSSEEEETTSSEEEETTSSAAAPTTSSAAAPTTSSEEEEETTSSAAAPTTSSAAAPTTSSAAAPTTSSAAAPTTSSAAKPSTSSVAKPSTTSSPAKSTTSTKKDCTTSSKAATTKAPSTTKALTTSSKPAASTTGPVDTCVKKPRPVPWCYFDFDFDFDTDYKNKGRCTDRSNKGHHGTFFGQPKGVSALWRLAASFFGTGLQYINIPNADDLGKEFTVATYIKFDALGESVTVANSSAWRVEVCAKSGKIYFHADTTVSWDVTFSTGVYIHVAVSVDAQGYARCYKDGKECGSAKKTSCQKHKGSLQACRHKGSFKGQFDDFFIFNYCLNIHEIISCKDKERDECATVTASKPSLTRASTKASTSSSKAATTKAPSTTKAATTKASTKSSTKDCDKTTSSKAATTKAPSTTKAATTKVVVPTTGGKKHCGVPWAYFSCDKTEHTKCGDDSGHGNHGSWYGPVPSQCGGKIRNGLNFAGSYHQAITVPKCGLAQSFTFSSWVKFQVQSSGSCKLASTKSSVTAAAGWELEFNGVTKVLTFYASGTSKATWDCKDLSAGSWFHLAVSVDEDRVEAYVNGNSKGQKTVSKCSQGGSLWIGNNAAKTGQFAGSLDEVCLFDKPLSSDQVAFARDTYNNVQKSSWSWSAQNDWGKDWEKSSLSGYKLERFAQWWNTQ